MIFYSLLLQSSVLSLVVSLCSTTAPSADQSPPNDAAPLSIPPNSPSDVEPAPQLSKSVSNNARSRARSNESIGTACPKYDFRSWIYAQKRCYDWSLSSPSARTTEPLAELFDPKVCDQGAENTSKKAVHQVTNQSTDLKPASPPALPTLLPDIPAGPVTPVLKEDMLSFNEWRRKVGEQMDSHYKQVAQQGKINQEPAGSGQGSGGVVGVTGSTPGATEQIPMHVKLVIDRARNFASHECGAKIVDANPESQFGHKALNEQKDDYMLNPCHASNWFVVELCETIQPQYLEIGNFELYSSIPKEFSVLASEHYPPRGEWSNLGSNFTAQDVRTMQGFKLLNNGFVKFLKISLKNYYGDKHFCPISMIRVFGTSLFDEVDHIDKSPHSLPVEVRRNEEESSTVEESLEEKTSTNLLGNAKKVVLNFFGNALNFNLINKIIESVSSNRNQTNPNFDIHSQSEVTLHYHNFELYLDECEHYFLEDPEVDRVVSLNIPSKCRFLRFTYSSDLFDHLYTQYFIRKYIDQDLFLQCGTNETYNELNVTGLSQIIFENVALIRSKLNNTSPNSPSQPMIMPEMTEDQLEGIKNGSRGLEVNSINLSSLNYGGTMAANVVAQVTHQVESSQIIQPTIMQTVINTLPLASDLPSVVAVPPTVVTPLHRETIPSHQAPPTPSPAVQTSPSPPVIKDLELIGEASKEVLSSSGGQSKEAVIVRLSNRIKGLESNISLMSAYLEDLSVRYRTQMEEMQRMYNTTIVHLNNTAILAAERDIKQQGNIRDLEGEIRKLRDENEAIIGRVDTKAWTHLQIHIMCMFLEIFIVTVMGVVFYLVFKRLSAQTALLVRHQLAANDRLLRRETTAVPGGAVREDSSNDIYLLASEAPTKPEDEEVKPKVELPETAELAEVAELALPHWKAEVKTEQPEAVPLTTCNKENCDNTNASKNHNNINLHHQQPQQHNNHHQDILIGLQKGESSRLPRPQSPVQNVTETETGSRNGTGNGSAFGHCLSAAKSAVLKIRN